MKNLHNRACLMIETPDHRKFFTYKNNLNPLKEFSKLFNAEISIVKVVEAEILDLVELAPAICDAQFQQNLPQYEIVEVKFPLKSQKIADFIEEKILSGENVELTQIAAHFIEYNLKLAYFCNQFTKVRQSLRKQGYNIKKKGKTYSLSSTRSDGSSFSTVSSLKP